MRSGSRWCERRDSNSHGFAPLEPKSSATASSPLSPVSVQSRILNRTLETAQNAAQEEKRTRRAPGWRFGGTATGEPSAEPPTTSSDDFGKPRGLTGSAEIPVDTSTQIFADRQATGRRTSSPVERCVRPSQGHYLQSSQARRQNSQSGCPIRRPMSGEVQIQLGDLRRRFVITRQFDTTKHRQFSGIDFTTGTRPGYIFTLRYCRPCRSR